MATTAQIRRVEIHEVSPSWFLLKGVGLSSLHDHNLADLSTAEEAADAQAVIEGLLARSPSGEVPVCEAIRSLVAS